MERYSRMLLHFAHALSRRHRRVEAFLFSTRLTRITTELRSARLATAVAAVSRAVPDWSGGTRIGEALRALAQAVDAARALTAVRWCCSSPTAGIAAIRVLASRRDGAAAAKLPSSHLAQPADWYAGLRAAHAGPAGRAALRGRFSAGPDIDEPRRPGGTSERARTRKT